MRLAIDRLHVRTSVPKRLRSRAPDLACVARELLPRALGRRFDARAPSCPAVCRIRRLRVRVRVSPAQLDAQHLADACADGFWSAFLTALHQPPEYDACIAAESRVEWLARVMAALLDGRSLSMWPLGEFAHHGGQGISPSVLGLVREDPDPWPEVLAVMLRRGDLDRLIRALGPHGSRDLAVALARGRRPWREVVRADDVVRVAQLAADDRRRHPQASALDVDAAVLRLIAAASASDNPELVRYAPGAIRSVLLALRHWARAFDQGNADVVDGPGGLSSEDVRGAPMLPSIVASIVRASVDDPATAVVVALREAIAAAVPNAERPRAESASRTRRSAVAGLFFLVPHIERFGWPERVRRSAAGAAYGSSALNRVLFGVLQQLLSQPARDLSRVDGGVSLLAGWVDEADVGGARRFTEGGTAAMRLDLARALEVAAALAAEPTWDEVFAAAGARLVHAVTRRLRGLSRSSQPFIVDRVLATPGEIDVDDRRILVRMMPNPLWPVVRLSGVDDPVDSISWLGGRRLEWRLEGL